METKLINQAADIKELSAEQALLLAERRENEERIRAEEAMKEDALMAQIAAAAAKDAETEKALAVEADAAIAKAEMEARQRSKEVTEAKAKLAAEQQRITAEAAAGYSME